MAVKLFLTACLLGGFGAFAGSVIGGAFGDRALMAGGFVGGVLVAPITARLALWRQWIEPHRFRATAAGCALGFLGSAGLVVGYLFSPLEWGPVGAVLPTGLTGVGALIGSAGGKGPTH